MYYPFIYLPELTNANHTILLLIDISQHCFDEFLLNGRKV